MLMFLADFTMEALSLENMVPTAIWRHPTREVQADGDNLWCNVFVR